MAHSNYFLPVAKPLLESGVAKGYNQHKGKMVMLSSDDDSTTMIFYKLQNGKPKPFVVYNLIKLGGVKKGILSYRKSNHSEKHDISDIKNMLEEYGFPVNERVVLSKLRKGGTTLDELSDSDIIEFANAITYCDRTANGETEITDLSTAKKIVEESYSDFDPSLEDFSNKMKKGGSLREGVKVEKEHRDLYLELNKRLKSEGIKMPMSENEFYERIAKAHVNEREDYYVLLKKYVENEKMSGGGEAEYDYFEDYDALPNEVRLILDKYSNEDGEYSTLEEMKLELEPLGYTFDYDLDAVPYNLRKIKSVSVESDEDEIEPFKKGGEVKKQSLSKKYSYVPNRDIKELSLIINGELKNISGNEVLEGVHVKKQPSTRREKRTEVKGASNILKRIENYIIQESEGETRVLNNFKKFAKQKDVSEFLSCGLTEDMIMAFYVGVRSVIDFKCDYEMSSLDGVLSLRDDVIKEYILNAIKKCKSKSFELGLKYPIDFNWSSIKKKYDLKKSEEIKGEKKNFSSSSNQYVFEISVGKNLVLGKATKRLKTEDDKTDILELESKDLYDGGYLGLVSSNPNILFDVLKTLALQEKGYVKDVDWIINRLGGVDSDDLDYNKIKYEDGGQAKWAQEATEKMEEKHTIGAFTKQAKSHGKTPVEFAKYVLNNTKKFSTRTIRRAQFVKNINPEQFAEGGYLGDTGGVSVAEAVVAKPIMLKDGGELKIASSRFDWRRDKFESPVNHLWIDGFEKIPTKKEVESAINYIRNQYKDGSEYAEFKPVVAVVYPYVRGWSSGYKIAVYNYSMSDEKLATGFVDEVKGRRKVYHFDSSKKMADGGSAEGSESLKDFVVRYNNFAREQRISTFSKGDLMKMAYGETYRNVDSALPKGLLEEKGISNEDSWHYVMDYNKSGAFGNLTDLFDVISEKNPTIEVFNDMYELIDTLPIMTAVTKYKDQDIFWQLKPAGKRGEYSEGGETGKTYQITGVEVTYHEDSYEEGELDQFHSYYLKESEFPYKTKFTNKDDLFKTISEFVEYGTSYSEKDFSVDEDTIQTNVLVKYEAGSDWDEFSQPTKEDIELWEKGKKKLYNAHFIFYYEVYKKEKAEFANGGGVGKPKMVRSHFEEEEFDEFKNGGAMTKKGGYSDKFKEIVDIGSESIYIRNWGHVGTDKFPKIELLAVATIRDLEGYISEDELPEEGNFELDITLVPIEKHLSKKHIKEANDDSVSLSDNTIANIVNYMGGLNYNPQEKVFFKTLEEAQEYLFSKEFNDKISAEGMMSGFILDRAYNRAGQSNWERLAYMMGEKDRFAKGGGVGDELTRGEIENKIEGLKLRIAKTKKQISTYENTNRGKYNKLWQEKVVPLQNELNELSELWGKSKYANGGGVGKPKMVRSHFEEEEFDEFKNGGAMTKKGGYSDKFKEIVDIGSESIYIRNWGHVGTDKFPKIELLAVATIRDLEGYISEDELPEEGNFELDITLVPIEKHLSKKHIKEANDDSVSLSDNTIANIVNYMGGLNYNPQEKVFFKTLEEAQEYLFSKEFNDKISAEGMMSGFILDRAYNRAGQSNWERLAYMMGEKDRFAKGGGVGDELTRGEIENKIEGLKLRIAKTKKQISTYENTNRGKYNKLWQEKVVPLQNELNELSELWGKSKYANGGGVGKPKMVRSHFEEEEFDEFKNGGKIKREDFYREDKNSDSKRLAKPAGYRIKGNHYEKPTPEQIKRGLKTGRVYKEDRPERSDRNNTAKKMLEQGGKIGDEISIVEFTKALGHEPNYPYQRFNGCVYTKCMFRPYYKIVHIYE
jgi:hypothetical protein